MKTRRSWRQGLASEAASEVLSAGFGRIGRAEIVSFTAVANVKSRSVMERIGMRDAHEDFEHPGVPEGHRLQPHCLYRITSEPWSKGGARLLPSAQSAL